MFPLSDENPSRSVPLVTVLLIAANTVVWFYQVSLGRGVEFFVLNYALIPVEFIHQANLPMSREISPFMSLFTSMFLHGSWMHFIGNMWFLWIFGDNVEDNLGHGTYLLFYLLTGASAGLVHVGLNANSTIPTLGASGAISGVLGAYFLLFPAIRIRTLLVLGFFIDVAHVPAFFFLGLWFLMQFLSGVSPGAAASGVAFGAHVGGFVAGMGGILFITRRTPYVRTHRYQPRRIRRW